MVPALILVIILLAAGVGWCAILPSTRVNCSCADIIRVVYIDVLKDNYNIIYMFIKRKSYS